MKVNLFLKKDKKIGPEGPILIRIATSYEKETLALVMSTFAR